MLSEEALTTNSELQSFLSLVMRAEELARVLGNAMLLDYFHCLIELTSLELAVLLKNIKNY